MFLCAPCHAKAACPHEDHPRHYLGACEDCHTLSDCVGCHSYGTVPLAKDHRFTGLRLKQPVRAMQYNGPEDDEWFKVNVPDWEMNYRDGECLFRAGIWVVWDRDDGKAWRLTVQREIDEEWEIVE